MNAKEIELKEGTLVLIKEDHIPCLLWPRNRVVKIHPAEDKVTKSSQNKKSAREPLTKLPPSPLDEEEEKEIQV